MSDWQYKSNLKTDVLIVGSGLAGLLLAYKLVQSSDASVVIACKSSLSESNSSYAQGGVAAATESNPFDSPDSHYLDTVKSGAGLTDAVSAREIIFGGGRLIKELDTLGVAFDKNGPKYNLALEGGHRHSRVLHSKDTTGRSITDALCIKIKRGAANSPRIIILENTCAVDLIMQEGVCRGAFLLSDDGPIAVRADNTVLATGGLGQVFERTTNPAVATGDGIAIAYRAGARVADMEFVQFHPTALKLEGAPAFLISEAVRGAGATLVDRDGLRFVQRFHPDGELATRDVVARAIHKVMSENDLSEVYLDLAPIGQDAIARRFPNIVSTCAQYGIDVLRQPIPVAPAAHYMMGGIQTTVDGQTSIKGLHAIGECACNGMHGANRLASNSLLEAGVMALKLSDKLLSPSFAKNLKVSGRFAVLTHSAETSTTINPILTVPSDLRRFRSMMYHYAGLVRLAGGLNVIQSASQQFIEDDFSIEKHAARNILQVGELIARAASMRQESRGAHLREDFSQTDDKNFLRRIWLSRSGSGWDSTGSQTGSEVGRPAVSYQSAR